MKSPSFNRLLWVGLALTFFANANAGVQDKQGVNMDCRKWLSKVDPDLGDAPVQLTSVPSDQEVIEAIGCLLRLQGNKRPARFGGATRADVSQILPSPTIELAALYYVSYLYDGHWEHADGVALWNRKGVINPPGSIDIAYAAYSKWFQKVKTVGIAAAKARRMDPLRGTGLRWYGK